MVRVVDSAPIGFKPRPRVGRHHCAYMYPTPLTLTVVPQGIGKLWGAMPLWFQYRCVEHGGTWHTRYTVEVCSPCLSWVGTGPSQNKHYFIVFVLIHKIPNKLTKSDLQFLRNTSMGPCLADSAMLSCLPSVQSWKSPDSCEEWHAPCLLFRVIKHRSSFSSSNLLVLKSLFDPWGRSTFMVAVD